MNESRAIDVIQLGARMHYAVPVFFHEKHLLGQLFTDIWIPNSGISSFINKIPISSIKKLSNRFRSEIPSDLVTSFFSLGLSYSEALRKNRHNRELETGVFLEYSRSFQQKVMQSGSLNSSYIYAFNTVAKDIFSHSESKSKTKILEQTLIPRKTEFDLLQSEFSFYGIDYQKGEKSLAYEQLELDENQLADIILCGSNFVKQSLIDLKGESDIYGNTLKSTEIAIADELSAAAGILMGQGDDGQPVIIIKGFNRDQYSKNDAFNLIVNEEDDLYR